MVFEARVEIVKKKRGRELLNVVQCKVLYEGTKTSAEIHTNELADKPIVQLHVTKEG